VKKMLAEEEHQRVVSGDADVRVLEMTASDFVVLGLDVEEQQ
jgi:hypothetical protein